MMLSKTQIARIDDHCLSAYPKEAVGVIIGPEGSSAQDRVVPCDNVLDELRDPRPSPQPAETGFAVAPDRLLEIDAECRARGWRIKLIYHSHPDGGTSFSTADRAEALAHDGTPLHPHVVSMVVAVEQDAVVGHALYRWDAERQNFVAL